MTQEGRGDERLEEEKKENYPMVEIYEAVFFITNSLISLTSSINNL